MIRNPDFHARNGYILAVHPSDTTLPREFREQCREYGVGDLRGEKAWDERDRRIYSSSSLPR
jgi:hypothetical protein